MGISSFPLFSQRLELSLVDNTRRVYVGEEVQMEIRLKINKLELDTSKYDLKLEPELIRKFSIITKTTGIQKIGPVISGDLFSNTIEINVFPLPDNPLQISIPESAFKNQEVKIVLMNTSNDKYSIDQFALKPSALYDIIKRSFSTSTSTVNGKVVKKEILTITIKPKESGKLNINASSFETGKVKNILFEGKEITIYPSNLE